MASSRRIQNPGIELNEIDRSDYGKTDYSLPGSPSLLITGFAPKGEDYALTWINSKITLDDTYGQPENEFEQYFYNAACEILNRGGTCIAAKLPYINDAFEKYCYVDYSMSLSSIAGTLLSVLNDNDSSLTSFIDISLKPINGLVGKYGGIDSIESFDALLTNSGIARLKNAIRIYDITRALYDVYKDNANSFISSSNDAHSNDFLGIVPVIVTPANALFFLGMLSISISSIYNENEDDESNEDNEEYGNDEEDISAKSNSLSAFSILSAFNQVNCLTTYAYSAIDNAGLSSLSNHVVVPFSSILDESLLASQGNVAADDVMFNWTTAESLSRQASMSFPLIDFASIGSNGESHFLQDNLKKIGVAVFKAFRDTENNGKVNFELLESFVGSLNLNARDPITKADIYIANVVNASSLFIRLFTNIDLHMLQNASTVAMSNLPAPSLGFYKALCLKNIDFTLSISKGLDRVLEAASNKNTLPIDIIVDAGVSNIALLVKSCGNGTIDAGAMTKIADYKWQLNAFSDTMAWKTIVKKLDDFAKYTRKDIMFIADGLRTFCLDGSLKIVRKTAPLNTVAKTVLPKLRWMSNTFESSYAAGYCNWFYLQDASSRDYIWIPPSIKAAGVYIYCDTYFLPWSAPAGLTRGILNDVVDVAFVPSEDEAGKIYSALWNYAMSYPIDGIAIEGHKTFLTLRTALDRINVRRLLLYLEKQTTRIARLFVYEGNTPYLRQKFVDALAPIYEDAVNRSGLLLYAIKCDDELNTPNVIDNNEMRCRIAVKPVKCVDFIVIDLIATRQSADVNEEVLR